MFFVENSVCSFAVGRWPSFNAVMTGLRLSAASCYKINLFAVHSGTNVNDRISETIRRAMISTLSGHTGFGSSNGLSKSRGHWRRDSRRLSPSALRCLLPGLCITLMLYSPSTCNHLAIWPSDCQKLQVHWNDECSVLTRNILPI